MVATGVLLLAKVLGDQGWQVTHEPEVDGFTPDLRIRKHEADFLVEAKHVPGGFEIPPAYGRLRAALSGVRTRTPANFSKIEVGGQSSLRGFVAFLRRALRNPRPGEQVYEEPGVEIRFDLHLPPCDHEVGVCFSYSPGMMRSSDRTKVVAAIDEKLVKHPFPLIIALQSIGGIGFFADVEDVLYGTQAYSFPISHKTGGPAGEGRHIRMADAATTRPNSDGDRVRRRLQAVLPFEVPITDRGWTVRARVLANPAGPEAPGLREFKPIPSLIAPDPEKMGYVGADGRPLEKNEQIADEFLP
jgi:hypothetical protein